MDSYPPAASAASRAFDAAFSKAKQLEAIRFGRQEIFFYLKDILLDQSPSTLSDPKATPKDEMEAKYERVVAASLSALKTLVEMVVVGGEVEENSEAAVTGTPASSKPKKSNFNDDSALDEELETLLSNKKMVKLSVHSNPTIRAAWFALVATICVKRPSLLAEKDGKTAKLAAPLASSVLNRFEETDPIVVAPFWNAVMAVLKVGSVWLCLFLPVCVLYLPFFVCKYVFCFCLCVSDFLFCLLVWLLLLPAFECLFFFCLLVCVSFVFSCLC